MKHLAEHQGSDYFNRRFAGAFFLDSENKPSIFRGCNSREAHYVFAAGTYAKPEITSASLPLDFFDSLDKFSVPKLGWRAADKGMTLVNFTRNNRGYGRGAGIHNLDTSYSQLTARLMDMNIVSAPNDIQQCIMVFNPDFTSLIDGVRQIREGAIMGFAVSHTIAVFADDDDTMRILYRDNEVGKIDSKNTIRVSIPLIRQQLGELS